MGSSDQAPFLRSHRGGVGTLCCLVVGVALFIISVASDVSASPPAGYRCGAGGKPIAKDEKCRCPKGKVAGRDANDVAVCNASPPSRTALRVESAPPGAVVYIDSKEGGAVGVTPWEGAVRKGSRIVIVVMAGYKEVMKPVHVGKGRTEMMVPLVRDDAAKIDVRADADRNMFGASVWLDGQQQGTAPIQLTARAGRHLVECKKDGFESFSVWVQATPGESVTLTPVLKELRKANLGTLVIDADVPDARVLIDGNEIPGTTPMFITDVIAGLHVVEVRKDPAVPWKQTVSVTAGNQVKVRAELRSTIAGIGAVIRVLSNVSNAEVLLDGTVMGRVPIDIKDVRPGEHILQVRAAGYRDREERVTVTAGSSSVLKLDLSK